MVEKKGRRIHESPDEVLRTGKSFVADLRFALLHVGSELHELRIEPDGLLGFRDFLAALSDTGINRDRELSFAKREAQFTQFGILIVLVGSDGGLLFIGAC